MPEEQLKDILEKVKKDTSLLEKWKAAANYDAVVAIAKEAGFSISIEDLTMAQPVISDEELERAAGGGLSFRFNFCGGCSDSIIPAFCPDPYKAKDRKDMYII